MPQLDLDFTRPPVQGELFAAEVVENTAGAEISRCGRYRYLLWRRWSDRPQVCWIMLNPSTADATQDDPTIRKIIGYSRSWGYGGLLVVNLFAWRATDPRELPKVAEPIGPANDDHIRRAIRSANLLVCAWGAHGSLLLRADGVYRLLRDHGVTPHALTVTATGEPGHPLYLRGDLRPVPYERNP